MTYLSCQGIFDTFHVYRWYAVSYIPHWGAGETELLKHSWELLYSLCCSEVPEQQVQQIYFGGFSKQYFDKNYMGCLKKIKVFIVRVGHGAGYRKAEPWPRCFYWEHSLLVVQLLEFSLEAINVSVNRTDSTLLSEGGVSLSLLQWHDDIKTRKARSDTVRSRTETKQKTSLE